MSFEALRWHFFLLFFLYLGKFRVTALNIGLTGILTQVMHEFVYTPYKTTTNACSNPFKTRVLNVSLVISRSSS